MLLNIALGFVLPWIFGVYLYRRHSLLILTVAPFASVVSFVINAVGFYLNFWNLNPPMRIETLSAYPLDLGLYPVLGCWCMILIQRFGRSVWLIAVFVLGITLLEGFGVLIGYASYANGWNLAWTFVSYLVAYVLVYQFYRLLQHVLPDNRPKYRA